MHRIQGLILFYQLLSYNLSYISREFNIKYTKKSPYEKIFRCKARVGSQSIDIPLMKFVF